MRNSRDLELLYEIGTLRFIERSWKQFLSPNFANLAEHHLRVIWLALILSKMEKKGDQFKIIKMALAHDLAESRTGDVHYISRQYTKRDEKTAMKDILYNTILQKDFMDIWKEYEKRKTIEAKIVKDADFLDVDLEIKEQKSAGRLHMRVWDTNRKIVFKNLFTASAKKLWMQIQKSKPEKWFEKARSRFSHGDMAQK